MDTISLTNTTSETVWLTPVLAARRLDISKAALDQRRSRGTGPPFCLLGSRTVRYEAAAVDEWARSRQFRSTKEYASAAA
jgi:predicted DNA-binding transcriptional regulator AlpA